MDRPDITARTLAELARDPAFASFATPDAALLIWDAGATRLLGVSPAAERLRWAFADAAGRVDPQLGARGRLQALGAGLAPLAGLRLERLRLDGLSAPVTCACRRVMLDGEPVLVTALLGPLPKASPPRPASGSDRTEGPREGPAREPTEPPLPLPESGRIAPVSAAGPAPAAWVPPTLDALKRHGAVRIVWQADRDGRFTAISPALAGIVGPQAADVVGRTWGEVAGSVVDDPGGAVADLLSRRLTWSGLTVYWSVDGAPWRIPVVWAGLPVLAADRTLAGFRGFGLLRTEAAEPRGGAGLLGPDAPEAPAGEGTPTIGLPGPAVAAAARTREGPDESWRTAALDAGDEPTGVPVPARFQGAPQGEMAAGIPAAEPQPLTLVPHGDAPAGERVLQGPHGVPKAMGRAARSSETLSRLSDGERNALREIARALGARFPFETAETGATPSEDAAAPAPHEDEAGPGQAALAAAGTAAEPAGPESDADRAVLSPAPMQAPGREEVAWLRQPARDSGDEGMAPGLHPAPAAGNGTAAPPTPEPGPRDEAASVGAAGPAGSAARWPVEVVPAPQQPRPEPVGSGPASDDLPGPPPTDAVGAAPETRPPGPAHLPSLRPVPGPAPLHVLAVPVRPVAGDRMLDQLPLAALVHRDERVLFANRAFLDLVGCESLAAFEVAGGLAGLFGGSPPLHGTEAGAGPMALATPNGPLDAEVSVTRVEWGEALATLILMRPERAAGTHARLGEAESARSAAERSLAEIRTALADAEQRLTEAGRARAEAERTGAEAAQGLADAQARSRTLEATLGDARARVRELEAVLDTATDGVAVVDGTGRILSLNRAAEALFGYDGREVVGDAITVLLAPESHMAALQYLDRLRSSGAARLLNDGREVMGRVRQGGVIPLFMTMGPVSDGPEARICAVLRDITAFKKAEGELVAAKRVAEEANAQKSDLLAKISHEIRTPLNAIIGFAEVMLEERFGPVGNERYKEYLKDVHLSGTHVISLVNDLLDLAKIEAGRMDLAVAGLSLNGLISASVALLQPQAARERIVLRTSFAPNLPSVLADERSVRQIALNLLSNAIKFTDPGGQVIVSTALTDRGEVAFRVRDTGIGMSEGEIAAALEPFRQLATARRRGGTGLGLPLTKALVEANRGSLVIRSAPSEGTLVEVLFPTARVTAG